MVDQTRRQYLALCAASSSLAVAGCAAAESAAPWVRPSGETPPDNEDDPEKIDDWEYDPPSNDGGGGGWLPSFSAGQSGSGGAQMAQADAASQESIGLAAGGAADIGTFRRNVYEGYLPIPESMTYEGLFHDYYFDTGGEGSCLSLFCPTYTPAVTRDPLSGERERYLSVGLDSGLAKSDFERPPLNLVIVLDISGSMSATFDEYYYDQYGNEQRVSGETNQPKIEVAKDVLADLTEQLRPEDRLGVVLFNNDSAVAKPVRAVERTDMEAIRGHIQEDIEAGGGTNISAGMQDAEEVLSEVVDDEQERDYENRMILLTDAQTNMGETSADELRSTLEDRAANDIHTSVVGIGVDFNANLINQITAVRGANYYSVYSVDQFEQRMLEEFEFMVTPLVFDLSLELDAEGYDIKQVYGSPAADEATGELMHVNTLFPSPSEDGKAKGGVVLVQVEQTGSDVGAATLDLTASWEHRDGTTDERTETVEFPAGEEWGSTAVRKAVLLARYANLMKEWTVTERNLGSGGEPEPYPAEDSIEPPATDLGKWELQSEPLTVSAGNAEKIRQFRGHFVAETGAIGDDSLDRELELMDEILSSRQREPVRE